MKAQWQSTSGYFGAMVIITIVLTIVVVEQSYGDGFTVYSNGTVKNVPPAQQYMHLPQALTEPQLVRPEQAFGQDDPIPAWVRNPGPNVSVQDSLKMQQRILEKRQILQERQTDQWNNTGRVVADVGKSLAKGLPGVQGVPGSTSMPLGEKLHQQNIRLGEIDQELQQLFDRNNIIASPKTLGIPLSADPLVQSSNNQLQPRSGSKRLSGNSFTPLPRDHAAFSR